MLPRASPRVERLPEDLLLLEHVRLVRSGRRARALGAADEVVTDGLAGEELVQPRRDEVTRAHVARLVLHPHQLREPRITIERRLGDEVRPPRVELLEPHDRDALVLALRPLVGELVVDLAGTQ